jgi:hypothetical protein
VVVARGDVLDADRDVAADAARRALVGSGHPLPRQHPAAVGAGEHALGDASARRVEAREVQVARRHFAQHVARDREVACRRAAHAPLEQRTVRRRGQRAGALDDRARLAARLEPQRVGEIVAQLGREARRRHDPPRQPRQLELWDAEAHARLAAVDLPARVGHAARMRARRPGRNERRETEHERREAERRRREGAPHGSASTVTTCALPRSSSR